jgi:putative hydrolase of the HAD superfamily
MINNLLFDLGGVIMDIRRENCVAAFERLGMTNANDLLGEYGQKGPFLMIENGTIDSAEFRREIRRYIPQEVTDRQIDDAFNCFLVGIPVNRLKQLEALKQKYGVYLLSNTNPLMWDSKIADEFKNDGHDINYYFDGIVTSFEAKAYKPDAEIFHYAAEHCGINPQETLFLDDSAKNVEAAISLGWNAVQVKPGDEFADLINQYLSR